MFVEKSVSAKLKPAFQKDDAFLADVDRVLQSNGRSLWWLGQSGFLIIQNGRAILLDPYLSRLRVTGQFGTYTTPSLPSDTRRVFGPRRFPRTGEIPAS